VAGGFLGSLIGPRETLWVAAIGGMLGFVLLLPTPLPRFRMPEASPSRQPNAGVDLATEQAAS